MKENCIFCRIAAGEIPAEIVYQDDDVVAFKDIHPSAPLHVLIIPRKHVETVLDADKGIADVIFHGAKQVALKLGLEAKGFRLVTNCGTDAGQEVMHIHTHMLAGRAFGWPPG